MHPGYYEGIVQLRHVDQTIVDFALQQFAKHHVSVAKMKKLKAGVDIYSGSNKFSRVLARKLQREWGGEIKEAPRLFTRDRQTWKNVYRLTVFYRPLNVKRGDAILREGKVYQITTIEKDILVLRNLTTGKKTRLRYAEDRALPVHETMVVSIKPRVQVLDPDYQPVSVINPAQHRENDSVRVVLHHREAYLV